MFDNRILQPSVITIVSSVTHHNGDFSKVAADLLAQGYGQPKEVAPSVDFSRYLEAKADNA